MTLSELLLRNCVELEQHEAFKKKVGYCSLEENANSFVKPWANLALMRYWARLMLAGVPVMVIWRSDDPSMALAILICAPDI